MSGGATALVLLLAGAPVEVAAGASSEVAVGRAPAGLGTLAEGEENAVALSLQPAVGLRHQRSRREWLVTYSPRIFRRIPNVANVQRPLVLHEGQLSHAFQLSPRSSLAFNVGGSYGELDYTAVGAVFGDNQTAQVDIDVARVARISAALAFERRLGPRVDFESSLSFERTTFTSGDALDPVVPIADGDAASGDDAMSGQGSPGGVAQVIDATELPDSLSSDLLLAWNWQLSSSDTLSLQLVSSYQGFGDQGRFLLLSPELGVTLEATPRFQFSASAGAAYVRTLDAGQLQQVDVDPITGEPVLLDPPADNALGGTGGISLAGDLYRAGQMRLTTQWGASLEWFFDPLAGTSQPRAGSELQLQLGSSDRWQVLLDSAFYTQLRDNPITAADLDAQFDQTLLRGEMASTFRLSTGLSLTLGVRASYRGPRLTADNFTLARRRELWAFIGLSGRFPARRDAPSWP